MTELRFTLRWPDRRLSPNSRTHWAVKAKAARAARLTAFGVTRHAMHEQRVSFDGATRLAVAMEFVPPDLRRRDLDNAIAATKNDRDGIADAVGIDDSRFVTSYLLADEPKKGGEVRVTVRGIE